MVVGFDYRIMPIPPATNGWLRPSRFRLLCQSFCINSTNVLTNELLLGFVGWCNMFILFLWNLASVVIGTKLSLKGSDLQLQLHCSIMLDVICGHVSF